MKDLNGNKEPAKCSIITIHHIHNFGSVFQAYSLHRFLKDSGFDAEIIDYQPTYYYHGRNAIKSLIGKLLNLKSYKTSTKKFRRFLDSNDNLSSKKFTDSEQLQDYYKNSKNIFISGGDQLWNDYHPCGKDDNYKLAFVESNKKIAYGTSMGRDNYTEEELKIIAAKTGDYKNIMLREKSTVQLLSKYTDVPVNYVIDPVALVDLKEFEKIAVKPDITEPYAVMYLADKSRLLDKTVEYISKKMGLKIVHICGFRKKCKSDIVLRDAGPDEILGYILNAEFVLSASFHATMFSILFNKQFATLLPEIQTNARIEDILNSVGLSDRIVRDIQSIKDIENKIDYTEVNKKLESFKENSKNKLLSAIGELKEE